MNISNPEILVFVFTGLFTMGAAIADWEWFMQHPKSVFWLKLFGRNGARTFTLYSALSSPCWRFSFADTRSICVDKHSN
ncbi:MAG: immunity 17 family protein [Gammaproteobacteria bacterium]